jgi:hypothetical protein
MFEEMRMVLVGILSGRTTWVSDYYLCKNIYSLNIFSTVLMVIVFGTY